MRWREWTGLTCLLAVVGLPLALFRQKAEDPDLSELRLSQMRIGITM
jgi:hypothetical protein